MAHRRLSLTVCLGLLALLPLGHVAWAQVGQIKTLTGEVHIWRHQMPISTAVGDVIEATDTLVTGADSSAGIIFIDDSQFVIGPNSRIELQTFRFNATTQQGEFRAKIDRGMLEVTSGYIAKSSPDAMQVKTRRSILGVRGTKFLVRVQE
jgi:hypothetical protein